MAHNTENVTGEDIFLEENLRNYAAALEGLERMEGSGFDNVIDVLEELRLRRQRDYTVARWPWTAKRCFI